MRIGAVMAAWLTVAVLGPCASGHAQEAEEAKPTDEEHEERNDDPMGSFGFGVTAGYLYYGQIDYQYLVPTNIVPGVDLGQVVIPRTQPSRRLPTLNFQLYLGDGFGFAWDFEGYLAFDHGLASGGGYFGPAFRFHIKRMYFSVGIGPRVGVLRDSTLAAGVDLYGRVPITLTYYLANKLALVFQIGFGWGGTGIKERQPTLALDSVPPELRPQVQQSVDEWFSSVGYSWGRTATFDLSGGFRFP